MCLRVRFDVKGVATERWRRRNKPPQHGGETCRRHASAHAILPNHAQSRPKHTNKWAYDGALVGVASCASPRARRLASVTRACVSCLGIGLRCTKSFQCLTSRGESSRRLLPRVRPSQTQVPPSQRQAAATRNKPFKNDHQGNALVACKRMQAYASVCQRIPGEVVGRGCGRSHASHPYASQK